jgi:hypothetical protein
MKLTLTRTDFTKDSTLGLLYVDETAFCYTCEDVVRTGPKVFGQTAIPASTYQVVITFSPHFQRDLPLLLNVPGFDGVRIHPGNTSADTEGCILVGMDKLADSIGRSRIAFDALFPKIQAAISAGDEVWITVS